MNTRDEVYKQQQTIARCEKSLILEKIKKRKANTRRKIELGGLVIKAGMDGFNKAIILGALDYACQLLKNDQDYINIFESKGKNLFLN